MVNILLINGHEYWETSHGKLNETLVNEASDFFQSINYNVKISKIDCDFIVEEEVEKFLWANMIIFFTPVYWFDIPAKFKSYIERVYSGGKSKLFKDDGRPGGGKYGSGGLLNLTRYMLITTWNAPEEAFNNAVSSPLFENKSVDDIFLHFHSAQKFLGMKKIPGIHFHDVKRNPDIELFIKQLKRHLAFNFS